VEEKRRPRPDHRLDESDQPIPGQVARQLSLLVFQLAVSSLTKRAGSLLKLLQPGEGFWLHLWLESEGIVSRAKKALGQNS